MGAPKYTNIQRRLSADQRAKNARLNPKETANYAEITTTEVQCKFCNFKARYKFFRCPECNKPQE